MKGSTVILVLVTLVLIVAQTHVEGSKTCCPDFEANKCFSKCFWAGGSRETCAWDCSCTIIDGNTCPPRYLEQVFALDEEDGLKISSVRNVISTSAPSDIIRYCKLGCTSSMCFPTTTPQNSADGVGEDKEIVLCNKACSYVCTKGADAGLLA